MDPEFNAATGDASELTHQLVVEVTVSDLENSLPIYTSLGFTLERRDGGFVSLRFGNARLFLDEDANLQPMPGKSRANVRILVPDVDVVWSKAQSLGLQVEQPIADKYYGLRDFTVRDPDGFGLRFATRIPSRSALGD
jgi:catechol 2,3-dioxygenase-like lactoylglutathione lyase family enzyme